MAKSERDIWRLKYQYDSMTYMSTLTRTNTLYRVCQETIYNQEKTAKNQKILLYILGGITLVETIILILR